MIISGPSQVKKNKQFGLPKSRRIKSQKIFDRLVSEGKSVFGYPLKIVYTHMPLPEEAPFQVAFGVSKKRFKRAVDRNKVKRILREVFRQNVPLLEQQNGLALLIIYVSGEIPDYHQLVPVMEKLITQIINDNGRTQ